MKTEIKAIKKTLIRGILEIENPFKQMGTTDVHITNQIEEVEVRISVVEGTKEEIDSLVKENFKFNKFLV